MGLTGSWTRHWTEEDTGNIISSSITYPAVMTEDDPNYDKRGTTEVVLVTGSLALSQSYEGVYVNIQSINLYKNVDGPSDGQINFEYTYNIYGNEASKSADVSNTLYSDVGINSEYDKISSTEIYARAYELLKSQNGFEDLTDVL